VGASSEAFEVEIRTITEGEFEAYVKMIETSFGGHARAQDVELERRVAEIDRCLGAFDGPELIGGASAASFLMSAPGAEVRTAGVTGVGVKPSHRRRGVNSALMRRQLDDIRSGGETVAALFASEGGIYGRFGYGLSSFMCSMDVKRERSAFVRSPEPTGQVRLLERAEALEAFLPIYERVRRERPGMIRLDERWLDYRFAEERHHEPAPRPYFYAAHEGAEGIDGYAVYHVRFEWTHSMPENELELEEVVALTPSAYASMWRYLLDVDLMGRVTAWNRPVDEPLLHLVSEPRRLRLTLKDGLWLRLVDVPGALEARRYAAEGRIVLEVRDGFCPWNEGRYELEGGPQGATCRSTQAEPDLACSVEELGAAYLGGMSFRELHRAGRVFEEQGGALARADAMFTWDPAPWCSFMF
jgi:predicted acetyltransferase